MSHMKQLSNSAWPILFDGCIKMASIVHVQRLFLFISLLWLGGRAIFFTSSSILDRETQPSAYCTKATIQQHHLSKAHISCVSNFFLSYWYYCTPRTWIPKQAESISPLACIVLSLYCRIAGRHIQEQSSRAVPSRDIEHSTAARQNCNLLPR